MTAARRKKPVESLVAPASIPSNTNLKARFEAVTTEIAAELRVVSERITNDIMNAIANASGETQAVREAVFMAVSIRVLRKFAIEKLRRRRRSEESG